MIRPRRNDLFAVGLFLAVAPATWSTSAPDSSPTGCPSPALPLAANYSRVSYGSSGATVVLRYECQEGYHIYGDGLGDRVEECGDGEIPIPSVCALDATRHEWSTVTLSSGYFPEKAVDDEDSGVHKGRMVMVPV